LCGYEAGAFTDAKTTKKGLLEIATANSFLDEIGRCPTVAGKLLRVIETKTSEGGGTRISKLM